MTAPGSSIRSYDDLIDAFRARKAEIGLSNEECERLGGVTKGHIDKMIGPSRIRNLTPMMFDLFCEMFAIEFHMKPNIEAAERMESRWERRDVSRVHVDTHTIGKALIERVKPALFKEIAARLTEGRKRIKPSTRRRLARQAIRARWKKNKARQRKRTVRDRKITTTEPD